MAYTLSWLAGGLETFFGGLEGLIGTPNPKLKESMEREHTSSSDSLTEFYASNYGTATTSALEWLFVVDPVSRPADVWPADSKLRADESRRNLCRGPRHKDDFEADIERVNALLATQVAALIEE